MKNKVLFLAVGLFYSMVSFGQMSGTKTIPGDYPSIASAISALNISGVEAGGVTFNIAAGYTETFSSLTAGLITATGAQTRPIVFQKNGTGANPIITASISGVGNFDYIICIGGGDYITFDGIDVQDNPANATATTRMEYGFALFKASGTDGAQHNTLKNGTINLSFNTNAYGITLDNKLYSSPGTTGPAVTAVSGTNSWNDFSNLTFNNCYGGFNLKAIADVSPFAFYDQDNTIGSNGGNTFSYTGLAGTTFNSYGINAIYQNGLVIANNTFTGSLSMTTGRYYAMNLLDSDNANLNVFNNTLSISFTGTGHFYGFYINGMGRNGTTNTVNFYNNQIINNSFPNHTNGNVVYAYVVTGAVHANCYNNVINNNAIGSTEANSTALVYYLYFRSDPVNKAGAMNYHHNTITNNTRNSGFTGTITSIIYFLHNTGSTDTLNVYDNIIENNSVVTNSAFGIWCAHIGKHKAIYNNTVSNISGRIGGNYGMYNANGVGNTYIYNNRIQNLSSEGNPHMLVPTLYYIIGMTQSSGNNTYYYNNYISQLYAPNAQVFRSSISGMNIFGLNNYFTGLYNNTIYLDGTSVNESFGGVGIYAETGVQLDMRNNIIVNNAIPTLGGYISAFRRSDTAMANYQAVSNNNNFYAGTPGPSNLIYDDETNFFETLEAYQAFVLPRDNQSVSEVPPFINASTAPYNLHISGNMPTRCESGGSVISSPHPITVDFDGDTRYPNSGYPNNPARPATAPDIGADEFAGLPCIPIPTISGPGSVCVKYPGQVYTTEAGMLGYIWVVSSGGTITAGTGTNSITVAWDSLGAQTVSVNYYNTSGCTADNPTVYNVTVNPLPVPTITGAPITCTFSTNNTYTTEPGMTAYMWNLSSGGTITSGAGTNSITVTWTTTGAKTVSVNYTNTYGCSALAPTVFNVTANTSPTPTITGSALGCQGSTTNVYSTQTGMTNYIWNVTGGTITAGAGTSSITVTWSTLGAQSVSVNYSYSSGCSAPSPVVLPVTVHASPTPVITGANVACETSLYLDYTTQPGMTNYVWDMTPNSGTITQTGTNVVTIFWTLPGAKWVSVNYTNANGCSAVTPTVYNVTVNPLPLAPGAITGTATTCAGATGVAYSVAAVTGATSYNWTLPAGATIASGAGTRSITVNFGTGAVSGNISVAAVNACGPGPSSPYFAVTLNTVPAAPGTITGPASVCQGTAGVQYSVPAITGATSYNWILPTGATVASGGSTNSITVNFSATAVSGTITVNGVNTCGSGTSSPFAVTVNTKPATPVITLAGNILSSNSSTGNQWYRNGVAISGATSQTYTIIQDGTYTDVVTINGCSSDASNAIVINHTGSGEFNAGTVSVYPNPNNGAFWLSINTNDAISYNMQIVNSVGTIVKEYRNIEVNGAFKQNFDVTGLTPGVYNIILQSDKNVIIRKIVIN